MNRKNIKNQEEKLRKIIMKIEKDLKMAPEGTLWVNKHGKGYQYYYVDETSGVRKYIKKDNVGLVKKLAQKEYNQRALKVAQEEYNLIRKLNRFYGKNKWDGLYEKIPLGKKLQICPIWVPDKEYKEHWNSYQYEGLRFYEDAPEYYSDKGERMRSKSEIMIANLLNKRNVPYRYECPLVLKSGETYYPDFTILNMAERKELYWEHMGYVDDYDYRERNLLKLSKYEANGIFTGDKLILTFETAKQPLTTLAIERAIDKYCV